MPHPYSSTIPGLINTIQQLRAAFPAQVTADTLRKWSIASNNEGPVLVVLRFLGLIDEEGKKQASAAKVFLEHDDAEFAKKFEGLVRAAYGSLFETWGEQAWSLERNKLIGFFRTEDETSSRVGLQQALTFQALAGLAGHAPPPAEARTVSPGRRGGTATKVATRAKRGGVKLTVSPPPAALTSPGVPEREAPGVGAVATALTVRIEINLPVSEDQGVYDKIFRSIRANLLNEPAAD